MEVAYTKTVGGTKEPKLQIVSVRNITVNVGCNCMAPKLNFARLRHSGPTP